MLSSYLQHPNSYTPLSLLRVFKTYWAEDRSWSDLCPPSQDMFLLLMGLVAFFFFLPWCRYNKSLTWFPHSLMSLCCLSLMILPYNHMANLDWNSPAAAADGCWFLFLGRGWRRAVWRGEWRGCSLQPASSSYWKVTCSKCCNEIVK